MNVGKTSACFRFELCIETVTKLGASRACVVWDRGNGKRVTSTQVVDVDPKTAIATFNNDVVSSNVTLFKTKKGDNRFQNKVVKMAVKEGGLGGKTIAKIHLNLAQHAEIPSTKKKIKAGLSNGGDLTGTLQCIFLGKEDSPSPTSIAAVAAARNSCGEEGGMESSMESSLSPSADPFRSKSMMSRVGSVVGIGKQGRSSGDGSSVKAALKKSREDNKALKQALKKIESEPKSEMQMKCDELEVTVKKLTQALTALPKYDYLIKSLKESKMSLAMLHLEAEKLQLEMNDLKRSKKKKRGRK